MSRWSPGDPRNSLPRGALASLLVVLVAALVFFPQQMDRENIWNIGFLVCLHVTLGQSWNVLAGFAGQTSLGHAAFFGIGAWVTRTLWLAGTPFALAMAAGGAAALFFGLLIGAPTFRLRGAYFTIGTLGMAEVLRIFVSQNFPLISTMSGPLIASYDPAPRYYLALALAVVTTGAACLLLRSRWSLGILALREDEQAAQATGVHVFRHKLLALAISSLFAGLAGALFAYQQISYYPSAPFGAVWTFDALLITFIGGLGTLAGPIIGAVFFVLVREQLAVYLVEIHQVIFGILFILIVLAFPGGLVQAWERLRALLGRRGGPVSKPSD
jgi:branched-chain amino acid transport system permease protein